MNMAFPKFEHPALNFAARAAAGMLIISYIVLAWQRFTLFLPIGFGDYL